MADIGKILKSIFGVYPTVDAGASADWHDFTLEDHIKQLNAWLPTQMHEGPTPAEQSTLQVERGCLGPATKVFDVRGDNAHAVKLSMDSLTVQSQTAFSTVKANCCVFRGKWMYEVQLRSKGIMQIGWCSSKCQFTQDTGVGDTRNSYGLDGSKQRLWHVQTRKYGPYWRSGDIIGVCVDMDAGRIEYHRNGTALGEAFRDIERGAGIALFPAVSMAFNDSITANFGGAPFRHPVAGYEPLQAVPLAELRNADTLLRYTIALARLMSSSGDGASGGGGGATATAPSAAAVHMVVAGQLVGQLGRLFACSYVIEEKVFAYVRSMCVLRSVSTANQPLYPGAPNSTLGAFLQLLWTFLDMRETKSFLSRFVLFLSSMYRETPVDLDYEKQRTVIVILTCLCQHEKTRRYLLDMIFFKKHSLPVFLYIKPPDESTLAEMLPDAHVWTVGIGGSKHKYLAACAKLQQCTDVLHGLQKNLVELLMRNDDHGGQRQPTSRKYFVVKMREYVVENCMEHRSYDQSSGFYGTPTQPAVALSFLCIVLDVLQQMFAAGVDNKSAAYVRPLYFYNGTLMYNNYDRLGGVLSYLTKTFQQELLDRIDDSDSPSQSTLDSTLPRVPSELSVYSSALADAVQSETTITVTPPEAVNTRSSAPTIGGQHEIIGRAMSIFPHKKTVHLTNGPIDERISLNDMLDCCIMYYYAVAHKYIVMIADLRDNIGTLSDILVDTKESYEEVQRTIKSASKEDPILNGIKAKFENRKQVFVNRSLELARKQVWYRAVALGERRRCLLKWMLHGVVQSLTEASGDGALFSFVPELYVNVLPILLDTCLDFAHHDLAKQYTHEDLVETLQIAAEFLANHAADTRILLASCKDSLLQALGTLTCHAVGMRQLEAVSPPAQLQFVLGLLRVYENRAWGQSNWLLIRFWLGEGFAYRDARAPSVWQSAEQRRPEGLLRSRGKQGSQTGLLHHVAPACPSRHYQALVRDVLMNDEPFGTIFLNSILSQLNWSFSEFVLLLQEIANTAQLQDARQLHESRSMKVCAMCFELTVSLMRSLEMLITIAPDICLNAQRPNGDLLLNRVCQLVSQVLARVTVPPGVFQLVVDLCLPDLTAVTHFAIISAAIGILLALLKDEIAAAPHGTDSMTTVTRVARILLTDPSFQVAHLKFALGQRQISAGGSRRGSAAMAAPKGNFDPLTRANIDPLTNKVRLPNQRSRRPDRPIVLFNLMDYVSHVNAAEIAQVQRMIEVLQKQQAIISEDTLPSDDSICPICYSKSVSAVFEPCKHQSCANCIVQHLMNNKVCFYCKTQITKVQDFDGTSIYECADEVPPKPTTAGD